MKLKHLLQSALFSFAAIMAPAVWAHPGHEHHDTWYAGLIHPLTGFDHIAAFVMMGAVAALCSKNLGGRLLAMIAACFVAGFAVGLNWLHFAAMESMVVGSLLVLPLVALAVRRGGVLQGVGLGLIALFGASHGLVMGTEATGSALMFGAGATVSSLALCSLSYLCVTSLLRSKLQAVTAK